MKNFSLLLAFFIALLPATAQSQETPADSGSKQKLIAELIKARQESVDYLKEFREAVKMQQGIMEDLSANLPRSSVLSESEEQKIKDEVKVKSDQMTAKMVERVEKEIDFEGVISGALAKFYSSRFTESELLELLTFYRSPVGQKLLMLDPELDAITQEAVMTDILPKLITITTEVMEPYLKELDEKLKRDLEELEDEETVPRDLDTK